MPYNDTIEIRIKEITSSFNKLKTEGRYFHVEIQGSQKTFNESWLKSLSDLIDAVEVRVVSSRE